MAEKRVNDMLASALNISLPSYKKNSSGGCTMSNDDWQMVIQVRTLRELEKLNRLLACPNFIGIPQTLREIKKNTTKRPKRKAKVK